MNRHHLVVAVVAGQAVGPLGYIEPIYVVLVLGAPLVTGALAAGRGWSVVLPAVLWFSAGLNMTWVDWLVAREDVVFHLVLSVVMALLAAVGHGLTRLLTRGRRAAEAAE